MPRESNQVIALKEKIREINIIIENRLREQEKLGQIISDLKNQVIAFDECLEIISFKPKRVRKAKDPVPAEA